MDILKFNSSQYERIFVVGDLHGCRQLLDISLQEVGFNKQKDLLLSVGDLVDRGKQNMECLALLYEPWLKTVRGNHEDLMYNAVVDQQELWFVNGGSWWYGLDWDAQHSLLPDICKTKIGPEDNSILPYVILVEKEGYLPNMVVHAEPPVTNLDQLYRQNYLLSPRQREQAVWSRTRITYKNESLVEGIGNVYCGHTVVKTPLKLGNVNYIDTGAVFQSGYLTVMEMKWVKDDNRL